MSYQLAISVKYFSKALLSLYLLIFLSISAEPSISSQAQPPDVNPLPTAGSAIRVVTDSLGYLTSSEFCLSLLVILFGVATLAFEFVLIRNKSVASIDVFKLWAVSLIVVGTLFLVTAGFSSQQIAPAMGLFGTIAGYLLGRSSRKDEHGERKDE